MITSKDVENVLWVLKEAEEESVLAYDEQKACEDKQTDILHEFELVDLSHNARGHLGKSLAEVRRQRRIAKDTCELLKPLCEWIATSQVSISALKRVLGDMRKIEEKQANRIYRRKADGKGEIISSDLKNEGR